MSAVTINHGGSWRNRAVALGLLLALGVAGAATGQDSGPPRVNTHSGAPPAAGSGATATSQGSSSTTAQAQRLPGNHAGAPVVAWAIRDRFPVEGALLKCGVAALDEWAGISSVSFRFYKNDGKTPLAVKTAEGKFASVLTVTEPAWDDLYGYGNWADYWMVNLDISGWKWTGETDDVVVQVGVTTRDGVMHDMASSVGPRVLRRAPAAPVVLYVDPTAGNDANDGTSWARAKKSLRKGVSAAGADVDIIYARRATHVLDGSLESGKTRSKFLRILPDQAGTGQLTIDAGTATRSIGGWIGFKDARFTLDASKGASMWMLPLGMNHYSFESCAFDYAKKGSGQGHITCVAQGHFSFINCRQNRGDRGLVIGDSATQKNDQGLISGWTSQDHGSAMRVQCGNILVERVTATGNAKGGDETGWKPTQHLAFINVSSVGNFVYENRMFRYIKSYNNGQAAGPGLPERVYNFMQIGDSVTGFAVYNCMSYCHTGATQLMLLRETKGAVRSNLQFTNNTFSTIENNQGKGVVFSTASYAGVLLRNMMVPAVSELNTKPLTIGPGPIVIEGMAVCGSTKSGPLYPAGTIRKDADPVSNSYMLSGLSSGRAEPATGSALSGAGVATDVRFDFNGVRRVSPQTIGAALSK